MAVTTRSPSATDPVFDPTDLLKVLDGDHHELRERVREQMSQPAFRPVLGLSMDQHRAQVMEWTRMIADAGFGVPGFPAEYGGSDDPAGNVVTFETIAHSDLSLLVKFGVQFGLWGGAIHQLGTRRHHDLYLRDTATARLLGCFAMTEHAHGSNVQHLETTATYDPGTEEFIIHTPHDGARKDYIGGAGETARYAAVFAQLIVGGDAKGVHCFVVPIRDEDGHDLPGVRTADDGLKIGLNGVDNGQIWFDKVRVPRENLLNRYAEVSPAGLYSSPIENPNKRFFTMLGTLVQGRICVGAAALSVAMNALTIAVRYANRRVQFGPPEEGAPEVPLMSYRTHQRRLLPLLARTYALYFAQQELTQRFASVVAAGESATEKERRELETLAAGLKAANTWHAMTTVQACREACGGAGYMAENRFGMMRDDLDIFVTFEGDNTVLTMLCARGLLTDYAQDFGGLNPVGMVGFVANQAVETVVERLFARQIGQIVADWIPGLGGNVDPTEEGPMNDHEYLLELFEWRQGHITAAVANRFRKGLSAGKDPFDVLCSVQDHLLLVGTSYVETFAFRAFQKVVATTEDPALKEVLARLLSLYGLCSVEDDKGFYQEHGRLAPKRTKQVTREVNALNAAIARQAESLVDAFGIPDDVLAAPIGRKSAPVEAHDLNAPLAATAG
ncbi:MAG TPA: acyl-CoA dehydrogenase [Solirubrobacteraceae bacterium]|nr:acyl-CoA dehydrogenase [Solirubrobacteraceae bacterium]